MRLRRSLYGERSESAEAFTVSMPGMVDPLPLQHHSQRHSARRARSRPTPANLMTNRRHLVRLGLPSEGDLVRTDSGVEARLKKELGPAAKTATTTTLDHFPELLVYKCLSGTDGRSAVRAMATAVPNFDYEMITMPRRGHGPRPVSVLSPVARTRYTALVRLIAQALPDDSRARGQWAQFREFGRTGGHSYVVDLDLASCYQFVDHVDLRDELLLRSSEVEVVTALTDLLTQVTERGRGLPQMLSPSDRLADAYLEIIGRRLSRQGWLHHRYADDFRVLAESWDEANEIIEIAATIAGDLGLILASHKTNIRRKETVEQFEAEHETFLDNYIDFAQIGSRPGADGPYGGEDVEDQEAEDEDDPTDAEGVNSKEDDAVVVARAYNSVLEEWHGVFRSDGERPPGMNSALPLALRIVVPMERRVDVRVLLDLVFDDPLRMENVCRYVIERAAVDVERDWQWDLVLELTHHGRRSPWAKLWLLATVEALIDQGLKPDANIDAWMLEQLGDRHEVVRAQAAWVISSYRALTLDQMKFLYVGCSSVSAAALAAVAGRIEPQHDALQRALNAIKNDSSLNQAAFTWAQSLIQVD